MKELSIEQKARAYDEALERARKIHKYSSDLAEIKRMEYIFSELHESDDEKIRKALIKYFSIGANSNATTYNIEDKKILAWLEKQGQKPAEWHREDEQNLNACLGYVPDEFLRRWLTDIIYAKHDKSAWSEEDEGFLNLLLAIFKVEHPNGIFSTGNITPFNGDSVTSNRIIDWIKSIKDKMRQKPVKWSDEDEDMVRYIGNAITCKESTKYLEEKGIDMIKAHRWLESFRERYTWKPSEEQLKFLQHYADQNNYDGTVLTSLLNDLKKL